MPHAGLVRARGRDGAGRLHAAPEVRGVEAPPEDVPQPRILPPLVEVVLNQSSVLKLSEEGSATVSFIAFQTSGSRAPSSFFCGSCAVLRRSALQEVSGIAVEAAWVRVSTTDCATSGTVSITRTTSR